ncbi:MAG: small multi-drug export protein [Candidatus Pacebacteria bacterium]|nr:small multi-drug export protein [Candidatus Paceibacterota bacterium]MDD2757341.1 small multi-drug export protein [Candidatus Paceibacterota bacterium]MDD3283461.1 small multi-drug export protein [Candidatus Paceibacterota bacterium]MDD3969683.1 small multi-drug export protein [Candidatus Paceibacterota bacterium]MDD4737913.1 small multi-drug export protein [Candidatus Paceibacterota bacterium]
MISHELQTFIIAATPVIELRGAIPIALFNYELSVTSAFIFSVLGNIFPVIFILLFFEKVSNFLSQRSTFFKKIFEWLFARTRRKHQGNYERFKDLFLVIFVAIPLPITGAWTGSLCAFLFGIPFKRAFPLISLGVIIAGAIVTLISLGIILI